ncbi:MAG: CehA/McbA family metallohydrolase [Candidatus Bathyarchaeota archaeon]|nr:MAG: CehA/McbA family metallohydrolase [Candidatus Bathyarchaeota archaeon]
MMLRIDLHIHTFHSSDSHVTIEDAFRRCRELGLDGFAITNHDSLVELPHSTADTSGLVIISGMEITAKGGHVIAFDIAEEIEAKLGLAETVERIHEQGGIAIIAHPYSVLRTWVNDKEIEEAGLDCVEVANAYQFPYAYTLAKNVRLAERLGLPKTGGSDAHIPRTVGRAYTILEAEERSVQGVLGALRKGDTQYEGRGISLAERLKLVRG